MEKATLGPVVGMVNKAPGAEEIFEPNTHKPPAQVEVLVVDEIVFVKTADVEKDLPVNQHRTAARKQKRHGLTILIRPHGLVEALLIGVTRKVPGRAREINLGPVPVEDLGAGAND